MALSPCLHAHTRTSERTQRMHIPRDSCSGLQKEHRLREHPQAESGASRRGLHHIGEILPRDPRETDEGSDNRSVDKFQELIH